MLSQLGVLMFLLVAGAELDLAALRGRRRFAFTVSHAGIAVPFVLGVALAIWLYPQHGPQVGFTAFALFVGISMSITAFPVLLRILPIAASRRRRWVRPPSPAQHWAMPPRGACWH